jgi:hypothetical protein
VLVEFGDLEGDFEAVVGEGTFEVLVIGVSENRIMSFGDWENSMHS